MEQGKFEIGMVEYLSGELTKKEMLDFEKQLRHNPSLQKEFDAMSSTWIVLNKASTPESSQLMDTTFYDMLLTTIGKQENVQKGWFVALVSFLGPIRKPQLAFGMLLLAVGLGLGYFLNLKTETVIIEKTIVSHDETEEVREQLVLTLLEQPSANKRLQAVHEASKLNEATERIIKALFTTLNKDTNINVRLVAVESLARYAQQPKVRMELVKSIALQDSPLVQIALADLMVALQEKSSIKSMKQLLQKPNIDTTVKRKLEESINHII